MIKYLKLTESLFFVNSSDNKPTDGFGDFPSVVKASKVVGGSCRLSILLLTIALY